MKWINIIQIFIYIIIVYAKYEKTFSFFPNNNNINNNINVNLKYFKTNPIRHHKNLIKRNDDIPEEDVYDDAYATWLELTYDERLKERKEKYHNGINIEYIQLSPNEWYRAARMYVKLLNSGKLSKDKSEFIASQLMASSFYIGERENDDYFFNFGNDCFNLHCQKFGERIIPSSIPDRRISRKNIYKPLVLYKYNIEINHQESAGREDSSNINVFEIVGVEVIDISKYSKEELQDLYVQNQEWAASRGNEVLGKRVNNNSHNLHKNNPNSRSTNGIKKKKSSRYKPSNQNNKNSGNKNSLFGKLKKLFGKNNDSNKP
ncbi:hypothetical protein BCR32DRAFT_275675 [Anaeromyces robustus]|uniref:Uncharacterized protein n=1 Tax=Anaeromyces robustus TaxID=1754192 RepID=A0A1Y1XK41_9FUNG|nr:hypothetical protein BCR32DRAFT_275675 [Anaeromyces robustus]|eukprot:ORX86129.1 hypothetical protein BCR32DRAFT_275675 [Anaeromyces robustus]